MEQLQLFSDEKMMFAKKRKGRQETLEDYDSFVKKFDLERPKTTDDCYTPPAIYEAVLDWLKSKVDLSGKEIMRPFYPGGDYKKELYHSNCVVVDNPPFSILSEITTFYINMGVKFFLFAPALTLTSARIAGRKDVDVTYIVCGVTVTYANGAKVNTSFVSNLFGDVRLWCCHELYRAVKDVNDQLLQEKKVNLPKYVYPNNVTSAALLSKIAKGADLKIMKDDCYHISQLQSQKRCGKGIFGNGFLLSDKAALRKEDATWAAIKNAAIERAEKEEKKAERAAADAIVWELSENEKRIIKQLGNKNENNI